MGATPRGAARKARTAPPKHVVLKSASLSAAKSLSCAKTSTIARFSQSKMAAWFKGRHFVLHNHCICGTKWRYLRKTRTSRLETGRGNVQSLGFLHTTFDTDGLCLGFECWVLRKRGDGRFVA